MEEGAEDSFLALFAGLADEGEGDGLALVAVFLAKEGWVVVNVVTQ